MLFTKMRHFCEIAATFASLFLLSSIGRAEAHVGYSFIDEPIDVVIPTVNKDLETLELCIQGIAANGKNIGRIIVVSDKMWTKSAEWFDEKRYPFTKSDVALYICGGDSGLAKEYLEKKNSRVGWYYQQLLKFYAPYVIPDISSNVLVLDSDTIFLRPTAFTGEGGGALFAVGKEYTREYFHHMERLTKGAVAKQFPEYSGICHHMLFQRALLDDLFTLVEKAEEKEFWKAFCLAVSDKNRSGASEYEIYFNFALAKSDQVQIRKLKWKNIRALTMINKCRKQGFDFVSCHSFMRVKR